MFIIELTYKVPISEIEQQLEAHKLFLEKYYATGNFLLSGRKNPRSGGIIIARADSLAQIQSIISEDPFHCYGLANYSITEFLPSMANEALKLLIQ